MINMFHIIENCVEEKKNLENKWKLHSMNIIVSLWNTLYEITVFELVL